MQYITRDSERHLRKLAREFPAVVCTGPRQSGKSTLLKHLFGKTHTYVNLDDPQIRERAIDDPLLFLEQAGERIILDEIQYVPELLSYLKIRIDEKRDATGRFIITGSQQFRLMKNVSESLAGRTAIMELLPFSFNEKVRAYGQHRNILTPQKQFIDSCLRGSFPELIVARRRDPRYWYNAYVQTYLERDIRTLHDIGSLREFERLLRLLATRCAQTLNMSTLAAETGVSVNTIRRWISILEAGRVIYLLSPYHVNRGKRITKRPKLYFLDVALVCHFLGIRTQQVLLESPFSGALFENYCIQETVKHLLHAGKEDTLWYVRTSNGLEVDLILERNGMTYPLEIKMNSTPRLSMTSSLKRFQALFAALPLAPAQLLTTSKKEILLGKNITVTPLNTFWKWLVE